MNISCRSLLFVVAVIGFISGSVTAIEPAWLVGKPMNQWFQINGTSGAAGANVVAWSSLILREDTTELFIAASGGHHDSSDNRVVSIKLTDDQPQWILRAEPTPVDQRLEDVAYYLDGLPSSRHNYQYTHWVPNINRIVLAGARGVYGRAVSFPVVDGFNPDTNEWDPPGTWRNITPEAYGTVRERNSSIIWTIRLERLDLKEGTLTSPITTQPPNVKLRWPVAHDTKRHQLFSLQWADGQGYGDAIIQSSRIPLNPGNTQILVTFKNSTALQMFSEEKPTYSSMDYDPINDRFLFYYGQGTSAGRIYVVTPNDGNEWEMSILPLADGSAVPEPATISGINRRFLYVPGLNVFVCMPLSESNIWFIRVANFEEVPQTAPYVASPQSSNSPSITNSPSVKTNITSIATRLHWIANALMLLCFIIIF